MAAAPATAVTADLLEVDLGPGARGYFTTRGSGAQERPGRGPGQPGCAQEPDPYAGWNLAEHVGDDPGRVAAHRRRLEELLGLRGRGESRGDRDGAVLAWMNQVHSAIVAPAQAGAAPTADALVLRAGQPGVPAGACVMVADCVPLLLAACDGSVVAAVHAGRQGMLDGVVETHLKAIAAQEFAQIEITPFISNDVEYLSADAEDKFIIAQSNIHMNDYQEFADQEISSRQYSEFSIFPPSQIDYMDVSPQQVVGVSAALIPFLEHDDANRALMGSNMQAQAVPLIAPEIPLVSTGMEKYAAIDSGQVLTAIKDGEILSVSADEIQIRYDDGTLHSHQLRKYQRSNQSTCIDQRPTVTKGERIKNGQVLADSSSTVEGKLALG